MAKRKNNAGTILEIRQTILVDWASDQKKKDIRGRSPLLERGEKKGERAREGGGFYRGSPFEPSPANTQREEEREIERRGEREGGFAGDWGPVRGAPLPCFPSTIAGGDRAS